MKCSPSVAAIIRQVSGSGHLNRYLCLDDLVGLISLCLGSLSSVIHNVPSRQRLLCLITFILTLLTRYDHVMANVRVSAALSAGSL